MIGIECDFDGTLKEFLNNIPTYLYDWYISEEEIIIGTDRELEAGSRVRKF